ncbi:MAG: hypothetical protein GQ529_06930 [Methyloprofundus sp.]|nr:hypothetical protein [Methyloprofundus sp.]
MSETKSPIYPNITVKLSGRDGNIFSVLGTVSASLRKNKVPEAEIDKFTTEALDASCYHTAIQVCFSWVNIK